MPVRWTMHRPLLALGLALGLLAPMGASPAAAAGDESIVYMESTTVMVTDPSGSAPQQISPHTGTWTPPRISPDGSTVAFLGQLPSVGIWLVGIDGSDPRLILPQSSAERAAWLAWSPEGDRIAWAKTHDTRIRFIDTKGVAKGTVTVCTGLGWTRPSVATFDWGRDGRLWVGCFDKGSGATTTTYQVRLMPQSGGKGIKRYQSSGVITSVRADPIGSRALVVVGNVSPFFVDAAGAAGGVAAPARTYAWSPDGARLLGWDRPTEYTELFTVPVGGGTRTWLGVDNAVYPDWGPMPATCAGGLQPSDGGELIIGTPADDVLEGTPGNDVICGLGGDDTIRGRGGDDVIDGGAGNDEIVGGAGADVIVGGKGRDTVYGDTGEYELPDGGGDRIDGGPGDDTVRGGGGDDVITGGGGVDDLEGNAGADELDGGADGDILTGGAGDDSLTGGKGDDALAGDEGDDRLAGDDGDDYLRGDADDDILLGGSGDDTLLGGPGRDRLAGNGGSDTLRGGPGNDHLTGGARKDRLEGEGGDDTLIARDGVRDIVRGGPGANDKARIDAGLDDVTGIETLLASVSSAAVDPGDEQPLDDEGPGELDGDGGTEGSSVVGGADSPASDDPDGSPASDAPGGDDGGGEAASTRARAAS
jgi:Ca2+-binding RTX toxin-like protein